MNENYLLYSYEAHSDKISDEMKWGRECMRSRYEEERENAKSPSTEGRPKLYKHYII